LGIKSLENFFKLKEEKWNNSHNRAFPSWNNNIFAMSYIHIRQPCNTIVNRERMPFTSRFSAYFDCLRMMETLVMGTVANVPYATSAWNGLECSFTLYSCFLGLGFTWQREALAMPFFICGVLIGLITVTKNKEN